jgi:hypothetical protein
MSSPFEVNLRQGTHNFLDVSGSVLSSSMDYNGISVQNGDLITSLSSTSLVSDVAVFDLTLNSLTLGGVASTAGQVLTADIAGKPYWATVPSGDNPAFSDLLNTSGDAGNNAITNLSSLEFTLDTSGTAVKLEGVYDSDLSGNILKLSSVIDESRQTRQYNGLFLPVMVGTTKYWIQLHSEDT